MDHREAAHRAGTEDQQREAGDQRGDVGIEDRAERSLVAGRDRRLRGGAAAHLFADAFVDQHVGVNRHTQRQRNGGDARQRQRGLQQRKQSHEQQQIRRERHHGDYPEHKIIRHHENRDGSKTPQGGMPEKYYKSEFDFMAINSGWSISVGNVTTIEIKKEEFVNFEQ